MSNATPRTLISRIQQHSAEPSETPEKTKGRSTRADPSSSTKKRIQTGAQIGPRNRLEVKRVSSVRLQELADKANERMKRDRVTFKRAVADLLAEEAVDEAKQSV